MRSVLIPLLLVIALSGLAQSRAPQRPKKTPAAAPPPAASQNAKRQFEEDQRAIAELQRRDIAASMGLDVHELLSLWTDDGVLLPPGHAPVVGRAALEQFYEQHKKDFGNNEMLAYEENWEEVQVSGDLAFQWGTISSRVRLASGEETSNAVHALRILKRQPDGSWLVARAIYNHASAAPAAKPPAKDAKPPDSESKPPQE